MPEESWFRSAAGIARGVRAGNLSPVEVTQGALDRIASLNPSLNAFVTLNERALDEARAVEARRERGEDPGLLAGVPVGIKDVTPVAGVRTTYGSVLYRDHVPSEDALIVTRLRAAGAIVVGKTNTPEFAAGGNTWNEVFGRTRNPWNLDRSAGGSTGGGAAALASGMIAIAEGTDLGGSLRIPASFCGVVGLRPSVGLVPTWPGGWAWDTLQVSGCLARSAEDVALALQVVAGPSRLAPLSQPMEGRDFPAAVRAGPRAGLRLAWCPHLAGIPIDPAIDRVCRDAVQALARSGMDVEEIELDFSSGRDAFLALRGLWFVIWMQDHIDRIDQCGINVRNNTRSGLETTVAELASAEVIRGKIWQDVSSLLERYDHLLTPTMAVPPFPVEENYPRTIAGREMPTYVDWLAPTFLLSLTGLPVASVPCGLDDGGLPVGLQIVGRPWGEEEVLALAGLVQTVRPIGWPRLVPPLGTSGED